jgi:hypothetical protein
MRTYMVCGIGRRIHAADQPNALSHPPLRLSVLNRDGRVLDDTWKGWAVHRSKLVDPDGNETTQGQLRAY